MKTIPFAFTACLALAACNPSSDTKVASVAPKTVALGPIDYAVWREVASDNKQLGSLVTMCAGNLTDLEAADPTLKDQVAIQLPWSVQATRKGKLQAQCVWTGPGKRTGRMVIDVLCRNEDNDHCSRFAYATEGDRRINAVAIAHHPPPPVSSVFPPGHDDLERTRSKSILEWTQGHAPDKMAALRVEFRSTRVGIVADAKTPFVCGRVREAGKAWRRFAVYSIGAAAGSPTYYWLREPADKSVKDFCDTTQENLQWYAVPDATMNGG